MAFLLINVQPGKGYHVIEQLRKIRGIEMAYFVTGPYDIIAVLAGDSAEIITRLVLGQVHSIAGITQTMTCIAVSGIENVSNS